MKLTRFAIISFVCGAVISAHANSVWNNLGSGNWNNQSNWTGGVPGPTSPAKIDNGGTALLPTGVSGNYSNALYVGYTSNQSGAVTISGGSLEGYGTYIGYGKGSVGTVTISSGTWTDDGGMLIGYRGNGNLLINGGVVSVTNQNYVQIGDLSTAVGTVTVSSGALNIESFLFVGNEGSGSLLINGGSVSDIGTFIGYDGTSAAESTVTVSKGTWINSGGLSVGGLGTGSLLINGGQVSSETGFIGSDLSNLHTGKVTVTGSGSVWTIDQSVFVGDGGSNSTLTIESGGLVKVGAAAGDGTIIFSMDQGTDNYLRLNGGYLALPGDQTSLAGNLINAGDIQLWNGAAWESATASGVQITYYDDDSLAQTATGHAGLGGYTVITTPVPEAGTSTLLLVGGGAIGLMARRRRSRTSKER